MLMKRYLFLSLVTILFSSTELKLSAQSSSDSSLIEFSGMVLTSDSLFPIGYVYIYEKYSRMGDVSDGNGYFAFTAEEGDTIIFNGIEFKKSFYVIPDTLTESKYNIIKLLTQDTTYLSPVILYPLPPRVQFDYIFVQTEVPDDNLEIARKNLERERLRQEALAGTKDAKAAYSAAMRQNAENLYWKGQLPPNNLLNPLAWSKFFESWQRGDYRKKKTKKDSKKN